MSDEQSHVYLFSSFFESSFISKMLFKEPFLISLVVNVIADVNNSTQVLNVWLCLFFVFYLFCFLVLSNNTLM